MFVVDSLIFSSHTLSLVGHKTSPLYCRIRFLRTVKISSQIIAALLDVIM